MSERVAGRELDAEIAEKVMGYSVHLVGHTVPAIHQCASAPSLDKQEVWLSAGGHRFCKWCGDMPMFSEDIAAAWQVVEKMEAQDLTVEYRTHGTRGGMKRVVIADRANAGRIYGSAEAPTAPLTICLAALAAVADPSGDEK